MDKQGSPQEVPRKLRAQGRGVGAGVRSQIAVRRTARTMCQASVHCAAIQSESLPELSGKPWGLATAFIPFHQQSITVTRGQK